MRRLLILFCCMLSIQLATMAFNEDKKYWDCPSAQYVVTPWLLNEQQFCEDMKVIPNNLVKPGEDCKIVFERLYGQIVKDYKQGKCSPSKF